MGRFRIYARHTPIRPETVAVEPCQTTAFLTKIEPKKTAPRPFYKQAALTPQASALKLSQAI
jgi:hypothetical protein